VEIQRECALRFSDDERALTLSLLGTEGGEATEQSSVPAVKNVNHDVIANRPPRRSRFALLSPRDRCAAFAVFVFVRNDRNARKEKGEGKGQRLGLFMARNSRISRFLL